MNSARRELDRMSYEAWGQLASDLKTGSRSMGRVGLSYARRHPALLLGGGALLGLAAVSMFRKHKPEPQAAAAPVAAASPAKAAHAPAWIGLLKSVLRMWLLDTLASEFRVEQDKDAKGESDGDRDGDGERENDLDPERAETVVRA